jgi:hypothetical protein
VNFPPNPADVAADALAAGAAVEDVDLVLTERCESSGQYLAGLLAAGTLDSVGRPGKLPELMFSGMNPWDVRTVWDAALAVGYRAGKLAGRPDWTTEGFDRLRAALYEAGYQGMARLADRTATVHEPSVGRSGHPEHGETAVEDQPVREGGRQ